MKKSILKFSIIILLFVFFHLLLGNITYTSASNKKVSLKKVSISSIPNQIYTGKTIKPKLKLTYKGNTLKNNKDYSLSYKSNKKVGKATILIKGKGKYTGSIKKYFYITPSKTKIKSLTVYNGEASIKWNRVKYADGYIIYMSQSKNKNYKKIKTINSSSKLSYTKKGLNKNKEYYFKIKAFSYVGSKKITCPTYSNIRSGGGLLISEKLTASNSTIDRNINLKIASDRINGITLKPGQKFKWSHVIGILTEAQGYRKAIAYVNGDNVLSVGGGVCQVSSTLYQCAKNSGMKIIERHEHGKPVTYIESGEDATVTYGLRDFIFENNTSYTIKIFASTQGSSTICRFYKISD